MNIYDDGLVNPGINRTSGPGVGKNFDPRVAMHGVTAALICCAYAFKDEPGTDPDAPKGVELLQKDLAAGMEKMKSLVTQRDEEMKKYGKATEETGAQIKALDEKFQSWHAEWAEQQKEFDTLKEEHIELVKKSQRPGFGGGGDHKSLGEIFSGSDQYEQMLSSGGLKSNPVNITEYMKREMKGITGAATSGGATIDPFRVPGIFQRAQRPFRLRDLMTINQTNERSIEFVKETNFYQLFTEVASSAAAAQADIVVDNAQGFFVGQTIVIAVGTGAEETKVVSAVDYDTNTITVGTNLANTHAAGVEITADDFVYTPETKLKPQAEAKLALVTEPMKTLAHWIPATRQILRNRQMLRSYIDSRLLEGLELSEENQILYGDGSSNQLQGIMSHADAQSYAWSSGPVGDLKVDAVRRAMTLSQLAHYPVDGVVLNPTDWEDIELSKGSDGHYIWVMVPDGGQMRLWRAPIVVTTAMKSGDFLVGAFRMAAALWDGESANIRVSDSHKDYFTSNMVAILAEQDASQTIYRPEAFVVGEFDAAPS